jgi:DinB superfamily
MLSIRIANHFLHTTFNKLSRWLAVSMVLAAMALPAMAQTTATTPARKMTEKDREYAINQLKASRERFQKSVAGLSEAQLKFKAAPERWSVFECAEHITLAEEFIFNMYNNNVLKTPATPEKVSKLSDEEVLKLLTDRSFKAQAPEPLKPEKSPWTNITDTMQEFDKRRAKTVDFVKTTDIDLRSHFQQFGNRGELDALQWILFISGHVDRHVLQIEEVKADPNFPKK